MGLLRRLFGGATQPQMYGAQETRDFSALVLNGNGASRGQHTVEVVGESNYQEALWQSVGSREPVDGRRHPVQAVLIWEHDNPHDPNAIAVRVPTARGHAIAGYLPRPTAAEYQPDFASLRQRGYYAGVCDAVIVGGFGDGGGGLASLGVWLDLAPPGKILPPDDE